MNVLNVKNLNIRERLNEINKRIMIIFGLIITIVGGGLITIWAKDNMSYAIYQTINITTSIICFIYVLSLRILWKYTD